MLAYVNHADERRRKQNRMAQRRFRQKNSLKKREDRNNEMTRQIGQNTNFAEKHMHSHRVPESEHTPQGFDVAIPGTFAGGLLYDVSFLDFGECTSQAPTPPPNIQSETSSLDYDETSSHISQISGVGQDQIDKFEKNLGRDYAQETGLGLRISSQSENSTSFKEADCPKWMSPLHMAARKGQSRIARMLLEHKADCDEQDSDGQTPLMHAIISGHEEIVRLLLSAGANIGKKDVKLRSALHLAVLHKRKNELQILLSHWTDKAAKTLALDSYDESGRTPLHTAIDTWFDEGVLLLLQSGANSRLGALGLSQESNNSSIVGFS